MKRKIRLAGKAPAVQEQEPYITAGNLERAREYLKHLEQERDKWHEKYMKTGKKLHSSLFESSLIRWSTGNAMFQILTGSEEVSKRMYERATERTV